MYTGLSVFVFVCVYLYACACLCIYVSSDLVCVCMFSSPLPIVWSIMTQQKQTELCHTFYESGVAGYAVQFFFGYPYINFPYLNSLLPSLFTKVKYLAACIH